MKVETFDIGDHVECDGCSKVYAPGSTETGGLLFESKGFCPLCLPRMEDSIDRYGEERFVRARANAGETFFNFIMRVRGGDNTVTIKTCDEPSDFFKLFESGF